MFTFVEIEGTGKGVCTEPIIVCDRCGKRIKGSNEGVVVYNREAKTIGHHHLGCPPPAAEAGEWHKFAWQPIHTYMAFLLSHLGLVSSDHATVIVPDDPNNRAAPWKWLLVGVTDTPPERPFPPPASAN